MTLNEIAYNIKNIVEGGRHGEDSSISIRQIKHMVHYHRARLITKWTEGGRYVADTFLSNKSYAIGTSSSYMGEFTISRYLNFPGNKGLFNIQIYDRDGIPNRSIDAVNIPFYRQEEIEYYKHSRFFLSGQIYAVIHESTTTSLGNRVYLFQDGEPLTGGGRAYVTMLEAEPTATTTDYPMPEELIPELVRSILSIEFGVMLKVGEDLTNNSMDDKFSTKKAPEAATPKTKQKAKTTK